jgi:L-arabinokinase
VELALACQRVENLIVGAPSGVMDPMTATLGEEGRLLELLCQPAEIRGQLKIPPSIEFLGIDSGVAHRVSGAEYGTVRTAAFMGRRLLEVHLGRRIPYLASLGSDALLHSLQALPVELLGSDFIARHGQTDDPMTRVEPERRYPVRAATRHPVEEHERVTRFAHALRATPARAELEQLGALMHASHASYSACGLGSAATDRLVELVRAAGPSARLFGAKITGGGCGGTVAVLAERGARGEVERVARAYAAEFGREPRLIAGSSPGAARYGAYAWSPRGDTTRRVSVLVSQ